MERHILLALFVLCATAQEQYCTTGTSVRVRSTPCTDTNNIVGTLALANTVVINLECCTTGCGYSWRRVNSTAGIGWMADSFLRPCDPATSTSSTTSTVATSTRNTATTTTNTPPPNVPDVISMVTGQFEVTTYPNLFTTVNTYGIPGSGYLRYETLTALKLMYLNFSATHPDISFSVVSAIRNFKAQKVIWENKWNGSYNYITNLIDRGLGILTYSSMPGTSRHHWGTDFDLTNLNADYWTKTQGLTFYNWLKANAHNWGFYQPYTAERATGYSEERWHWSYAPLAIPFVRNWVDNRDAILRNLTGSFLGFDNTKSLAFTYVTAVNPALLPSEYVDPNDYTSTFYCANKKTNLFEGPCSNRTALISIDANAVFRGLSCCSRTCNGVYRFGTFGEKSGYVDNSLFTLCYAPNYTTIAAQESSGTLTNILTEQPQTDTENSSIEKSSIENSSTENSSVGRSSDEKSSVIKSSMGTSLTRVSATDSNNLEMSSAPVFLTLGLFVMMLI
eukprot:TRINITY_DN320_c0_g1_i1.p1 TRINITY_DN320_c0_g1~~TRINITY_DN320_c0_g1_i1.p1  ORF type:complete len:506 (-),score=63.71 TRINITY_DN320_c0_g1_i1:55-1572(-)